MRLLYFLHTATALNILLSATDSWVAKNVRYLHAHLKQEHTVVLVGTLYQDQQEEVESVNGGKFGHLLPLHQRYQRVMATINHVEVPLYVPVETHGYGQDPLDADAWYVNGLPLAALAVAWDIILPQNYPGFVPDVVILGPNEGLHLTADDGVLGSMLRYVSMVKGVPVVAILTEDSHQVYFQDEKYFRIHHPEPFKPSVFATNIAVVNHQVLAMLTPLAMFCIPLFTALNVNFPTMNHADSRCTRKHFKYRQVAANTKPHRTQIEYSVYADLGEGPEAVDTYEVPFGNPHVMPPSVLVENVYELAILAHCKAVVNVFNANKGYGLDRIHYDAEAVLNGLNLDIYRA